jgi:hypothetical protein
MTVVLTAAQAAHLARVLAQHESSSAQERELAADRCELAAAEARAAAASQMEAAQHVALAARERMAEAAVALDRERALRHQLELVRAEVEQLRDQQQAEAAATQQRLEDARTAAAAAAAESARSEALEGRVQGLGRELASAASMCSEYAARAEQAAREQAALKALISEVERASDSQAAAAQTRTDVAAERAKAAESEVAVLKARLDANELLLQEKDRQREDALSEASITHGERVSAINAALEDQKERVQRLQQELLEQAAAPQQAGQPVPFVAGMGHSPATTPQTPAADVDSAKDCRRICSADGGSSDDGNDGEASCEDKAGTIVGAPGAIEGTEAVAAAAWWSAPPDESTLLGEEDEGPASLESSLNDVATPPWKLHLQQQQVASSRLETEAELDTLREAVRNMQAAMLSQQAMVTAAPHQQDLEGHTVAPVAVTVDCATQTTGEVVLLSEIEPLVSELPVAFMQEQRRRVLAEQRAATLATKLLQARAERLVSQQPNHLPSPLLELTQLQQPIGQLRTAIMMAEQQPIGAGRPTTEEVGSQAQARKEVAAEDQAREVQERVALLQPSRQQQRLRQRREALRQRQPQLPVQPTSPPLEEDEDEEEEEEEEQQEQEWQEDDRASVPAQPSSSYAAKQEVEAAPDTETVAVAVAGNDHSVHEHESSELATASREMSSSSVEAPEEAVVLSEAEAWLLESHALSASHAMHGATPHSEEHSSSLQGGENDHPSSLLAGCS